VTKAQCRAAAKLFGYTVINPMRNRFFPTGCFEHRSSRVWLNSDPDGSSRFDSSPVCEQPSPTPAPTRVPTPPFEVPGVIDTPGWQNNFNGGCELYEALGWCANGDFGPTFDWTGSPHVGKGTPCETQLTDTVTTCAAVFNYPADNCVVCGKGRTGVADLSADNLKANSSIETGSDGNPEADSSAATGSRADTSSDGRADGRG